MSVYFTSGVCVKEQYMPHVNKLSNVLMALPTSVPAKVSAVDMVSLVISRTGGKASAIKQTSRRSTRKSKAGH